MNIPLHSEIIALRLAMPILYKFRRIIVLINNHKHRKSTFFSYANLTLKDDLLTCQDVNARSNGSQIIEIHFNASSGLTNVILKMRLSRPLTLKQISNAPIFNLKLYC